MVGDVRLFDDVGEVTNVERNADISVGFVVLVGRDWSIFDDVNRCSVNLDVSRPLG